jgi:hypothetical protein
MLCHSAERQIQDGQVARTQRGCFSAGVKILGELCENVILMVQDFRVSTRISHNAYQEHKGHNNAGLSSFTFVKPRR